MKTPGTYHLQKDIRGAMFETATKQISWPEIHQSWSKKDKKRSRTFDNQPDVICRMTMKFKTSRWDFDGNFEEVEYVQNLTMNFGENDLINVTSISLYPLDYVGDTRISSLRNRGQKFWQCRRHRYVQYEGSDVDGVRHPVSQ
jgi:hypothetical protein